MSTLNSEELTRHLASGIKPLYVVTGEALLLAIEAADTIRAAGHAAGYTERETFTVEQYFKWEELRTSSRSLSLFAERKIIEIRIPSGKPGVEGAQALQEYVTDLSPDILTLVTLPKLDKTTLNSKWYGSLQQHGVVIQAEEIPRTALPTWLAGRLKRQAQSAGNETLQFLADQSEGNLLAAFQEIQKLVLLYPAGPLSFEQVKDAVMDVSRYDIGKLSEAMLNGNAERFARILEGLRAEGTATVLVLWAMSEDIRKLGRVLQAMQRGSNIGSAMRESRIWGTNLSLIENAARRIKLPSIEHALHQAARLDKTIKGLRQGDVWDELLQLGLRFAKTP